MIHQLNSWDIVETFRWIPAIASLFPWWIHWKEPLDDSIFPYMYVYKRELTPKEDYSKDAHVVVSIVSDYNTVLPELEDMFNVIDNSILNNIDWCVPIKEWGTTIVNSIEQWALAVALKDAKENLILRKPYIFTYLLYT